MNDAESNSGGPRPGGGVLANLVILHFSSLLIFTAWAFGGQAPWVRQVIAGWGAVGVLLFIIGCATRAKSAGGDASWPALRHLWPLWLYDLLVGASCFNPSFRETVIAGQPVLVQGDPVWWLPGAARPLMAWKELWQFNVIVLTCFNLCLVLPRRRLVRTVLFVMAGNAVVLAVFGTFQKLVHADGLWFGLVPSPNPRFFSTFIYHNHCGAFTLLNTAAGLGLLFHFLRRGGQRDIWHSPVPLGVVATLLLATSVPLSASRSCTVLTALLLFGALTHFLARLIRRRRERHESALLPAAGIVLAALLAAGAIAWLSRDVIAQRARLTSQQVTRLAQEDTLNSRLTLYRDTWRMAAAKPVFGWGLESYAHVFRIYNSQRPVERWFDVPFYAEAHNDWLQSLAEVGFTGTGLLALLLLGPLLSVPWRRVSSVLPRYLLAGAAIVLLYAWVEFPFANPAVMLTFCASVACAVRYAALDVRDQPPEPR
ncbi:MAG: O-antigen ligase family protein [Opitutae bacterium]|nr:O-antigen ligase family protein [Opitutae bacterium]